MNLLNVALSIQPKQKVSLVKITGSTTNALGFDVKTYATCVPSVGSFQPVPRTLYEAYGLDLQKNYATFYTSSNIKDIERAVSGDIIEYDGKTWQCLSSNDWRAFDGWEGVLLVEVPALP